MPSSSRGQRLAFLLLVGVGALAVLAGAAGRPASERMYVTVTDSRGKPVAGLTKDDFRIRFDAVEQEVLEAVPAQEPVSIIFLTDRLGLIPAYTPIDIGDALRGAARAVHDRLPDSRIALTTFDGPVIQVTTFDAAFSSLERALGRLATNVEDAVLLDGLMSACGAMRAAPTDRRVILVVLAAYRPDRSTVHPEVVGETLRLCGASLWVVEVRQAQGTNYSNPVREQVLDAGSRLSGGTRDTVSSRNGLASTTKHLTELILAQYAVTFGPGGGTSRTQVSVEVRRPDVRVFAPGWVSR